MHLLNALMCYQFDNEEYDSNFVERRQHFLNEVLLRNRRPNIQSKMQRIINNSLHKHAFSQLIFLFDDSLAMHVRNQNIRNLNGAVFLLVIFKNGCYRSANCES